MPISRSEFDRGKVDPQYFLLEFFRSHRDTAYSMAELVVVLSREGLYTGEEDLQKSLEDLRVRGWLEAKEVRGVVYYIRRPLGFRPA